MDSVTETLKAPGCRLSEGHLVDGTWEETDGVERTGRTVAKGSPCPQDPRDRILVRGVQVV